MRTNRALKPQMENYMTTEPQPMVLNPTAVPNQEPKTTLIEQQQPSSIPKSSIILDPPETGLVNPNISLLTGNQSQVKMKISEHSFPS